MKVNIRSVEHGCAGTRTEPVTSTARYDGYRQISVDEYRQVLVDCCNSCSRVSLRRWSYVCMNTEYSICDRGDRI
jgi:hypothetical protein